MFYLHKVRLYKYIQPLFYLTTNGGLKRKFVEERSTVKDHVSPDSPSNLRKTITKLTEENVQMNKKLQTTRIKNVLFTNV